MARNANRGFSMRRSRDYPVLMLSQDYELFFYRSGSVEKCLIEPTNALCDFAKSRDMSITFFVDAGMLQGMKRYARKSPAIEKQLSQVSRHIESLHGSGHEIGLHIHPHWEDTRWVDGEWHFADTRFRLKDFSDAEITDIVHRYSSDLNALCDGSVRSYRAGGFCIEPFERVSSALRQVGVTVDSSVVPGAQILDQDKGIDYRNVPDAPFWGFQQSPLIPRADGEFLEIPITPIVLPVFHYWRRAVDRVLSRQPAEVFGDGLAKAIGCAEVARRLTGQGRTSELSIDAPKAGRLVSSRVLHSERAIWQVMGHPKLIGRSSIETLEKFIKWKEIRRFESISGVARAIRAGEVSTA